MTESEAISKLIATAEAEDGYLEKASNANLDDKTANAGSANYTKYGRDMHQLYPETMDEHAAWCDCFVDWCFYKTFGDANARKMLCGNYDDYTVNSAGYYKNAGRWYTSSPQKGDQIFFKNSSGTICHTGIVTKVTSSTIYTIEGNTSSASGVVANGGAVRANKTYSISYSLIAGYGRPKWDVVATTTTLENPDATDSSIKGTYKTTKKLNFRSGAGTSKTLIGTIPSGATVTCNGEYANASSTKWYLVTYNGQSGYACSTYLSKVIEPEAASSFDKTLAGTYKTTATTTLRAGAGTSKEEICSLAKSEKVTCYGYYSVASKGTNWYLISYGSDGVTGYVSSTKLEKV